ncbi:MAG: DUF5565 family protein [Verrucomicrobiota bacterium]
MKKISSLFQRDYEGTRLVLDKVVPGSEWVLAGEGQATRKYDGTCCMIRDGQLYKRFDCTQGREPPEGFIAAQEPDPTTGHWPGWLPVGDGPEDGWHREALTTAGSLTDGTYELCGPKIQGNPDGFDTHILVPHGKEILDAPRDFNGLKSWLESLTIEGVVWHHPDGRMVKIKRRDFFKPAKQKKYAK